MITMDRRALLKRALLLAGAAVLPGGADALAQAAKEGPRLLAPARFALLTAVADTIIPRTDTPGAVDAGVPQAFDALLRTWASAEQRAQLTAALDAIDRAAREKAKAGFVALTPAKRLELLTAHDAAALKPGPDTVPDAPLKTAPPATNPDYGRLKQEPLFSRYGGTAVSDPGYAKLKELIVVLYYYSEPALTHELAYEHSPGEWLPSIPVTPETRPWGGAGLI